MLDRILHEFGLSKAVTSALPIDQGLINRTWKISTSQQAYILQRINRHVFHTPEDIDANIRLIAAYLAKEEPGYVFTTPVRTPDGRTLVHDETEGYFRLFPYIEGTHTKDTVQTADEAYEAARQFGKFTAALKGIDVRQLHYTIPGFHDLNMRFNRFLEAVENGDMQRKLHAVELIHQLLDQSYIADRYAGIQNDPSFRLRVTHHDTKISNVLFDERGRGVCVIDLDTVMPGHFISDVGDMMRTYLCPVSEEENDISKIEVRRDVYDAIVEGYMAEMSGGLTEKERQHFFYAGTFMIYMQALRFMTDYLSGDTYYAVAYPEQNYNRTRNQLVLLQRLMDLREALS